MYKEQQLLRGIGRLLFASLLTTGFLVFTLLNTSPASAHSTTLLPNAQSQDQPAIVYGPGKLNVTPSAAWWAAKNENRMVTRGGHVSILSASTIVPNFPASFLLNDTYARIVYEPPPVTPTSITPSDSLGHTYNDPHHHYANFCAPGASTVTLSYWSITNALNFSHGSYQAFTEPASIPSTDRITTDWNSANLRDYLMYMAEGVLVPGWTYPGEVTFTTTSPYAYTATGDIVNALNWEASGHSSTWQNYFYGQVPIGSMTQAQLNSKVMNDLYLSGSPVIVITNTGFGSSFLPSWNKTNIIHAIAIIGYDNTTGKYTYIETCGKDGCGSLGQGEYQISQSTLYYLMQNASGNGALVW